MKDTKNMKKLFYRNIMGIVTLLACIALTNYIIDPFKILANYDTIARLFSEGNNIEIKSNMNERLFKKTIIEQLRNPVDTLVVGSSRSMIIYQDLFNESIFNASVSGGGLEDSMAMLDIYIKKFGLPKKIILGIDPWAFNLNSDSRYLAVNNNYQNMKNVVFDKPVIQKKNTDFYHMQFKKYFKLLEIGYLKDSIVMFSKNDYQMVNTTFYNVIDENDLEEAKGNVFTWADASLIYSKKYKLENNGQNWKAVVNYQLNNFSKMDVGLTNEFEKLIDYLYVNDVKIEIFLPPYSPILYNQLAINYPQYYAILNTVEEYIVEKSRKGKFIVVGSYNPYLKDLEQKDFYDGTHVKKEKLPLYFVINSK